MISTDHTGKALDQRAYQRDIKMKLIQPGKPTKNAFVESFVRAPIAAWRRDYNEH